LLERARAKDPDAWEQFYRYYEQYIEYLLEKLHVGRDDMPDLMQEIMLGLTVKLEQYKREKISFRKWLSRTVAALARHHLKDLRAKHRNNQRLQWFLSDQTEEQKLDDYISEYWKAYVVEQALKRVEKNYKGKAIQVFRMTMDGVKAPEIAQQLEITEPSVYLLRSRVKSSVTEEVEYLVTQLEYPE